MTVTELPGLDVVREALRRSMPEKAPRRRAWRLNRPGVQMMAALIAGAALIDCAEAAFDMLRPVTAVQAVLVGAVVRAAAQERKITERELWDRLLRERGSSSPQQLSVFAAKALLYEVAGQMNALTGK